MKIKCIDNKGNEWFNEGKEYRAWKDDYGSIISESELDEAYLISLNNPHGVFELVEEEKTHPHADLMLKYAMIAQYDDKPWESFECDPGNGLWCDMFNTNFHTAFNYRLKPQEPKIQVGEVWVSKEGVEVIINVQSNKDTIVFMFKVGGMTYRSTSRYGDFLQNFKRKE